MVSAATEQQRLLLVDYDGNVLHELEWRAGRYVFTQPAEGSMPMDAGSLAAVTPEPQSSAQTSTRTGAPQATSLLTILTEIQEKFGDITNAVLTTADGQILSSLHDFKAGELATVAILAWSFLHHTTDLLDCGNMREVLLRDAAHILVMYPLAERAMLSVIIPAESNLGMLHWVCREALEKISTLLPA